MKAASKLFVVTAVCNSRRCNSRTFTVERKKIMRRSTSGDDFLMQNIVCPECRMWADVQKIEKRET